MPDSAELLRRYAQERSQAAFAEVVRLQLDFVYSIALRRANGDAHLAKDIAQAVFSDLAKKATWVADRPSLPGWLCKSTQFAASAAIRAERRRRVREAQAQLMHESSSNDAHDTDWAEVRPLLDRLLGNLGDADRDALMLRFYDQKSFAEMAVRLRIAESSARMRVDRALEKLRAKLARHGITSSCAALTEVLSGGASAAAPAGSAGAIAATALASVSLSGPPAILVGLTAILCLPMAGLGVRELLAARRAEASLARASASNQATQAELGTMEASARAATAERETLRKKLSAQPRTEPAANAAPGRPSAASIAETRRSDGQRFLAAFPESRAMLFELGKAQFAAMHAQFYRSADLAPYQIANLENAATQSWLRNLAITPTSVGDLPQATDIPADLLRLILGDQGLQQIQAFERMTTAVSWVGQMAASVAYSADPLSADQSDQLAAILAANSGSYQAGRGLDRNTLNWDQVQAQAKSVLAPSQWPAVQSALLRMQYQTALEQAEAAH